MPFSSTGDGGPRRPQRSQTAHRARRGPARRAPRAPGRAREGRHASPPARGPGRRGATRAKCGGSGGRDEGARLKGPPQARRGRGPGRDHRRRAVGAGAPPHGSRSVGSRTGSGGPCGATDGAQGRPWRKPAPGCPRPRVGLQRLRARARSAPAPGSASRSPAARPRRPLAGEGHRPACRARPGQAVSARRTGTPDCRA